VSLGASWSNFIRELSKGDSAVLVLVHLRNDLIDFLLGDVEASALNDSLKFISGDAAIAVEVKGVERIVGIEVWVGAELLTDALRLVLSSKVSSPAGAELVSSSWSEAVITSVDGVLVVRWSSSDFTRVVIVESQESCLEFSPGESTVSAGVVPFDEKVNFVLGWEETDGAESVFELVGIDDTVASLVEDFEGIGEVEVIACSKTGLVCFNIILDLADVLEAADELVFISGGKNWSSPCW